jgi:hypothetical protein
VTPTHEPPPKGVPTLTEVVDWPAAADGPAAAPPLEESAVAEPGPIAAAAPARLPGEAELVEQVLAQVQRQLDLMIEQRLREALSPLLARTADHLVREARNELASTLRDVVARAVSIELTRQRNR